MKKRYEELSIRERVRRWVMGQGVCSVQQAAAALGRYIPAAVAVVKGRTLLAFHAQRRNRCRLNPANPIYTVGHLADLARRRMIGEALQKLAKEGKLTHLSQGVYGPPLPRIYAPEAESA